MIQPLFVNFNNEFVNRIGEEAGGLALVTPSYVQGLRMISDPDLPISAIYLNPNDASYSALKFLAISSVQRPATPVFLLDEEAGLSLQNFSFLSDKFKIQGVFIGRRSFYELVKPLMMEIPDALRAVTSRAPLQSRHPGFVAVPVIDFLHSKKYLCNVFVEDDFGSLKFFALEGSEVDLDYLTFLSERTAWVYIAESTLQSRKESFHDVEKCYLDPDYLSPAWRSAEALYRTKSLIEEIKKGGISAPLLEKSHAIVEDISVLVNQLSKDPYLNQFIEQARQSDRAVACTVFSVLVCNKMKMKTNSIVDNLGLASFLQDISLYNSPYGNISDFHPSELSPEAKAFYDSHPTLSANLLLDVESIPEVTRQIIRQHHERFDRSGFPAKVGGFQLQPLAEILSLINSYLDYNPASDIHFEVYSHYSDRLVRTFKELRAEIEKDI